MTPFDTLVQLRKQYPTPMTPQQNASLLNDTAWAWRQAGWGVYKKPVGTNCPRYDGLLISRDILSQEGSPTGVDCLQDSEGMAVPVWSEGVGIDPANWTRPIVPQSVPVPVPPNPQPPVPPQPVPPPTTYAQFVNHELPLLATEYRNKHHVEPSVSDLAHLAWRRLVEHWSILDMLKDL